MRYWIAGLALIFGSCSPNSTRPEIEVSDAWVRESRTGASAAYATVFNRGPGSDRLMGVTMNGPGEASLHETHYVDGVARMQSLANGLDIPAGESAELRPGAAHIMLIGLAKPPSAGETLPLILNFKRSGDRTVEFEVRSGLEAR